MLDPRLIALEHAAVEVLAATGMFDAVTRRKIGALPDKTSYFEADIMITPKSTAESLFAEAEVLISVDIRIAGRGVDGVAVLDGVRFRSDLALARLLGAAELAELWANIDQTAWQRMTESPNSATVIVEDINLRTKINHTVGIGAAVGAVAAMGARIGAATATASVAAPVVHPAGLGSVLVAPAAISALFVGADDKGSQRLELRNAANDELVEDIDIAVVAGEHRFTTVPAGEYTITVVDIASGNPLAKSAAIRVLSRPQGETQE